ncbi:MAG: tetratricopeptide repeat protein [Terriglobia bacterium]
MSAPRRLRVLLFPILVLNTLLLHAKDNWMSLQTRNFLLVGNTSEGNLRNVAMKFEQFRDTFSRLFKMPPEPPYPGTVIVFKNESSFRPFKPLYQGKPMNVGGFYAAGPDVNYIALCLETSNDNPYHVIYHEYVHQLLNGFKVKYPLWLNEGLAEYYGTFAVTDGDKKVLIGKPIANHILFLRQNKLLPLQTLFTVDAHSPFYNEKSKVGVFYAQSWTLVHYLMLGNPQRHKEFIQFLNLQLTQVPLEESFRQAFGTDFPTLEKELDRYVQRLTYPMMEYPFEKKIEFDTSSQSRPLSESEVQFYLGDLLLHNLRDVEAEEYLKRAIELDPESSPAHASLGMLYLKQHQLDKAKESFAKAIHSEKASYLVHYYYAQFLVDDESRTGSIGGDLSKEKVQTVRAELKKAISLAPKFPESYALLAYVNLTTGEELDESIQWVNTAKKLAPGKEKFDLLLAQLFMRKEDYKAARPILERLASQPDETGVDLQAQRFWSISRM